MGSEQPPVLFELIADADLVLERIYAGGTTKTMADDPLARMFPVGDQGGFRYRGSVTGQTVRLVALYMTGLDPDWPDVIEPETGDFTYCGDNKTPGSQLHDTRRHSNEVLRDLFAWSRLSPQDRRRVPPILRFEKAGAGRSVRFRGLLAPGSARLSAEEEQYPPPAQTPLLQAVYHYFAARPVAFEHFAADHRPLADPHVETIDVTRPTRDGGRDGVGSYLVGPATDPIRISFSLEAKCFRPGANGVNVRMVSRLISRIKHRDFGVLVTTAHVGAQPYAEVREDGHPVVFITGRDVVDILRRVGLRTVEDVAGYPAAKYPMTDDESTVGDLAADLTDVTHPELDVALALDGQDASWHDTPSQDAAGARLADDGRS